MQQGHGSGPWKTIYPLGSVRDAVACYLSEVGRNQQVQLEQVVRLKRLEW